MWSTVLGRAGRIGKWASRVLAGVVMLGFAGGLPQAQAQAQIQSGTRGAEAVPGSPAQITLTFAPIVKAAAPAVVNVFTQRVVREARVSPLFNDPFFQRFFGGQGMNVPQRERVQRSLGSGVILGEDGVIVTNAHVVKDAEEITVALNDRREFAAELVGIDERVDLAVLRVKADEPLPTLPIAEDAGPLEVGDLVLAIGNPFGVGQTVTNGIVSALARTTVGISDFRSFIQTDAAINPGNSGGALVDVSGKLVGINTAIYSQDGGSVGIGFAIPVEMVKAVVAGILADGHVSRPWFGADGQTVTRDLAGSLGLDRPIGVAITEVIQGGPADKAGLLSGDVVLSVDGRPVVDADALKYRIAVRRPGDKVPVHILRNGKDKTLTLTLAPLPETPARDTTMLDGPNPFAGAEVANMNPALAEELGLDAARPGVTVLRIRQGAIAVRAGLRPGDRVLEVNGAAIKSVSALREVVNQEQRRWIILLDRNGRTLRLALGG
ncbi:MAG: DegQ family serine endoprotease [Rhodospirillum sp.]|nr:DegQ family serine endoprotease [Rhodospirillum sp.]MCF8488065.1 DegQ family serine endoprotease [Rhodospirillum sp.]MCF8502204.1 DegQ family serine endoprotease [Rhodospirillum sp.]